ncbi:RNA polymerase sigma factor [Microterricola viridarii]|uniref:RNA polymerase sigma factor n=1 Tax=Microterricola viridarii TaxID=412690 RepID=A0A120I099_9MICO|nr:sigma-70 family RNA polymerase sigma factor [Microterricola viridarii]AMB58607.1 hypothetical protein AWU67_06745 [Microterricola viridarii]
MAEASSARTSRFRVDLSSANDITVAGRAADGDPQAFEELVRRYGKLMRFVARSVLGSDGDADDVVQDAFVSAWHRLDTLSDPAAVKPWLMRIVTRCALDTLRKQRPQEQLDENAPIISDDASPSTYAEHRALNDAIAVSLQVLPTEQRRCWVLRNISEYSYHDIAAELGVPESTVRGLLSRARKRMIEEMEAWR